MNGDVNVKLLLKVLKHFDQHPEEWDPVNYVSGSPVSPRYCLAGLAYEMGTGEKLTSVGGLIVGNSKPIVATATKLLGFTRAQAVRLFFYTHLADVDKEGTRQRVTFDDMCARIFEFTGVRYEPGGPVETRT